MSADKFRRALELELHAFSQVRVIQSALARDITLAEFHECLKIIFHQVKNSSNSFSLAAAKCHFDQVELRDYLIKHAEEEKDHWKWVRSDLVSSGYIGVMPDETLPDWPVAAYVAYNNWVADHMPIGRLGIAIFLETVGAEFGGVVGASICEALGLSAKQVSFFISHGDTDGRHRLELWDLIASVGLSDQDWVRMEHHMSVAANLYRLMYQQLG